MSQSRHFILLLGHKLKVLAGIRRKYADDIGRFIFPIVIETYRDDFEARQRGERCHTYLPTEIIRFGIESGS